MAEYKTRPRQHLIHAGWLAGCIVSQRRLKLFQLITPPVAVEAGGSARTGARAGSHAHGKTVGGEKTLQCLTIVPLAALRLGLMWNRLPIDRLTLIDSSD